MGERKNKYQKYLYSNNNVHVLLPRLSMHEFFGAVGFSANKYIFDIQFWLDLNNLDDNAMFVVDDNIIRLFGYKGSESARNDNTRTCLGIKEVTIHEQFFLEWSETTFIRIWTIGPLFRNEHARMDVKVIQTLFNSK